MAPSSPRRCVRLIRPAPAAFLADMPFDGKRMIFGGFKTIVEM
jgi:uncharacterized protein YbaA (DUF1428 family)